MPPRGIITGRNGGDAERDMAGRPAVRHLPQPRRPAGRAATDGVTT